MASAPVPYRIQQVPNLVQGVSQQADGLRRNTQAAYQLNIFNSPADGAVARPGTTFTSRYTVGSLGADLSTAFFHSIVRTESEIYAVCINNGALRVFNMVSGVEASVSFPDGLSYLGAPPTGRGADHFCATSIEDTTIIANKTITPIIDSGTRSPVRPSQWLVYWKAGGYKTKYKITLRAPSVAGSTGTWTYTTPDNSVVANAAYITTDQLAATFYRAMTGAAADTYVTSGSDTIGGTVPGDPGNSGGSGASASIVTASGTAGSLGYTVAINGSVLLITRSDGAAFDVAVSDGTGGTHIYTDQGGVQKFSDLPKMAFSDYIALVRGDAKERSDDYWVKFDKGTWSETVKPDTALGFDANTMPWRLINTGVNAFVFKKITWGTRLCGDGDKTGPDPSFIGAAITDLDYEYSRFAIVSSRSKVWSKLRSPFVFFPDSAQAKLDTDSVDSLVQANKVSIMGKVVHHAETSMLWAKRVQFRITTGDQPFKDTTVEIKEALNYEFDIRVRPLSVSTSLFFMANQGGFTQMKDVSIRSGQFQGDTPITQHVPKYLLGAPQSMCGSDILSTLFVLTTTGDNAAYIYQWLFDAQGQRAQSAWNRWEFPKQSEVLWGEFYASKLYLLFQISNTLSIEVMNLDTSVVDGGGGGYLTRLDRRMDDNNCVADYDPLTDTTTITYPCIFDVNDGNITVVPRTGSGRGHALEVLSEDRTKCSVTVGGNLSSSTYYLGIIPVSKHRFSRVYDRDQNGIALIDRKLTVNTLTMQHSKTLYYRVKVTGVDGRSYVYDYEGQGKSIPLGGHEPRDDNFTVPIRQRNDEVTIEIINDTHFPSTWIGAQWNITPEP